MTCRTSASRVTYHNSGIIPNFLFSARHGGKKLLQNLCYKQFVDAILGDHATSFRNGKITDIDADSQKRRKNKMQSCPNGSGVRFICGSDRRSSSGLGTRVQSIVLVVELRPQANRES